MSGIEPGRRFNRRRVGRGLEPIYAICSAVIHDYGFGDTEDCECTNPVHSRVIRKW